MKIDELHLPLHIATSEITRICEELERTFTRQAVDAENGNLETNSLWVSQQDTKYLLAAQAIIRQRKRRSKYFPNGQFFDPVWDILLDLFVARLKKQPTSISSACIGSGVPSTTALRYLSQMTKLGMINRFEDRLDGRRIHLELSEEASCAMKKYLAEEIGL